MKSFALSSALFLNVLSWSVTRLEGTSVVLSSPTSFQPLALTDSEQPDNQIKLVRKYMMNYKKDYVSFIYVTTNYPGVKFNLDKSVEGNIRGMINNKFWHNAELASKKEITVCGVRGIQFTIKGKLGEQNAQSTSISFKKGDNWYIFTNTFGVDDPENAQISSRMVASIK